jgi:hypothetical protein
MKIALCLYGHTGINKLASLRMDGDITKESQGASTGLDQPFRCFTDSLLSKYDTDVFIHTWSHEKKDVIKKLYNPKKAIYEEQINFQVDLTEFGIQGNDYTKWKVSEDAKKGYKIWINDRPSWDHFIKEANREAYRVQSRWYSTKKSIDLKRQYELENNFEYDYVVVTRFDCVFFANFQFEGLPPGGFFASKRMGRVDLDEALFDFYFMTDSKTMDKFGTLYDHIKEYCIRPTFACREHLKKHIGDEKLYHHFTHHQHYDKA